MPGSLPRPLRAGVVGIGHLGRQHARILSSIEGVTLVGVVDTIPERAQGAAGPGTAALTDYRDLLDAVDAVVVAVPTDLHHEIGMSFIARGVATLVEKPLARSLDEADSLVAAAARTGAPLAVGHTERYNPAVQAILPLVTTPRFIEVHRLSAFPDRSLDIDVVFDLMIHDLDVVLSLVRSEVVSFEAVGVPVLTDRFDIANVRLRFATGCIANLTASRISRDRVRKVRFFQPDMYVSVDYAAQEAEAWRLVRRDGAGPAIEGGKLEVRSDEPLRCELEDFLRAAREGTRPLVTGEDGRRALALAQQIAARMEAV